MHPKQSASRAGKGRDRRPVTGVRLPGDLVVEAKHRALDERRSLREVIELALRAYLSRPPQR